MNGELVVAQRIAALEGDAAVKKCLQQLFTHELDSADQVLPHYKSDYEKAIARHAGGWQEPTPPGEEES